ncbi:hypothetical protein JOC77_000159 [Peribacillus deserti]|uniref:Uncharacterized protein n=1 Tax=Peribacillus deserti TaxID=673318 RepID=A0ABS2QC62_9BACI|nr:hypothetical protein [Peribacillus deserti]MBM7690756.1 hypothetical protein [Peribacillus deserti]
MNDEALTAQIYSGDSGTGWDLFSNPAGHWLTAAASIDFNTIPAADITSVSFELLKDRIVVAKWVNTSPAAFMSAYGISGTGIKTWEAYFPSTDVEGISGNVIPDDTTGTTITRPENFTSANYQLSTLDLKVTVETRTDVYVSNWTN